MINRFRTYQQNTGTLGTVIWVVVLGYLIWNQFQFSSTPITIIMLGAMGLCLLAPLAIMPICERYPVGASKAVRLLQYAILVFFLLSILGVINPPAYVYLILILLVFFYFGWNFWFFSSPAIFTQDRLKRIYNQNLDHEEAQLQAEIARNQQELDELHEHERPGDHDNFDDHAQGHGRG